MGKIPVYQRQKFASTYVGGPQVDKSGEAIVAGIGKAVETGVGIAAEELGKKEQQRIDSQANNALLKFNLDLQQNIRNLKTEYADNPAGLTEAVQNMGIELQNSYASNIADERVRTRFGGGATQAIKQTSLAAIDWAGAKEEENALLAAEDTVRTASILVGQTTDVNILNHNIATVETEILKLPGVGRKEALGLIPDMVESHLLQRVREDPNGLEADLNDPKGPYRGNKYFTDKMRTTMLSKIKTQRNFDKRELQRIQGDAFQQAMLENTNRTLTLGRLDEMFANGELRKRDYVNLKEAIFNRVAVDANKLYTDQEWARDYIDLVKLTVDSREERTKKLTKILTMRKFDTLPLEEERKLIEWSTPLEQARDAAYLQDVGHRLAALEQGVGKFFPARPAIHIADAFRKFIQEATETEDLEAVSNKILGQALKDSFRAAGYDMDNIPAQGKRIEDVNGNFIWVYPDGTYKEE